MEEHLRIASAEVAWAPCQEDSAQYPPFIDMYMSHYIQLRIFKLRWKKYKYILFTE